MRADDGHARDYRHETRRTARSRRRVGILKWLADLFDKIERFPEKRHADFVWAARERHADLGLVPGRQGETLHLRAVDRDLELLGLGGPAVVRDADLDVVLGVEWEDVADERAATSPDRQLLVPIVLLLLQRNAVDGRGRGGRGTPDG